MSYPLLERINAPGEIKNLPMTDCLLYTSDAADDV